MLAGNVHELRQPGARADVNSVVALFSEEFIDGDGTADDDVGLELDAHFAHVIDLFADDLLRKAEFGDAIDEHAAEFVQGFEHAYLVTFLDKITGNRET